MKYFKISFGSGLVWLHTEIVEVEDFEHEQDALDILVDKLEAEGSEGCFVSQEEIDSGNVYPDEYVIAGNHGRALMHYGELRIEEIDQDEATLEEARRYTKEHSLLWNMNPDDIKDYESLRKAVLEVEQRNSTGRPQARMFIRYMADLHRKHSQFRL